MSYFEVGVYNARNQINIGTLWRSAYQLGAAGIFTIGRPYSHQTSDTSHAMQQIPMRHYLTFDDFLVARPVGAALVGIEMGGIPLSEFQHPTRAIYLLGGEDNGLPERILSRCNAVVSLEAVNRPSFNLAVTGSIVMYHRIFLGGLVKQSS
jgi:tRNA G18 (ribose-2'-O)-methylase SpoU